MLACTHVHVMQGMNLLQPEEVRAPQSSVDVYALLAGAVALIAFTFPAVSTAGYSGL